MKVMHKLLNLFIVLLFSISNVLAYDLVLPKEKKSYVRNAVDQGKVKAAFQIIAIQLIKKTACFDPFQGGNIVL